jgi:hypothetical protein
MEIETEPEDNGKKEIHIENRGSSGSLYGIGMIGAWVYYLRDVKTFQEGLTGFLKGIVWPAIVVYRLLQFLEKQE